MARVIGNRKSGPLDNNPVSSLNSILDLKSNNHDRLAFIVSTSASDDYRFHNLVLARMNHERGFDLLDNSLLEYNLFRGWRRDGAKAINIKFSEDKIWCAIFCFGRGVVESSTDGHDSGIQFFKWNPTVKRYDHLDSVAGTLDANYSGDMSHDGQYACLRSSITPYFEFYKRTGDVWARVNLAGNNSIDPGITGVHNFFNKQFGYVYWGNDTTQTVGAFVCYEFDGTEFVQVPLTGVGTNGYWHVEFTDNGYFAAADISYDLGFWKTSDGINFTELTITDRPNYAHYNIAWDPTGTYLFASINNAGFIFGMYKRVGDTLTYLSSAFDQVPPSTDVTIRNSVTWSPDSKYVFITADDGTAAGDGSWMYERVGDQFYKVDLVSEATNSSSTLGASPYPDKPHLSAFNELHMDYVYWW